MSLNVKNAIRATVRALKAELAKGEIKPELRDLTCQAVKAAERAVGGGGADPNRTR
jgi:hypothetical protein